MTDIFEDFEKSIDDAFKPKEKKVKKKGYMFNKEYDQLLREKYIREVGSHSHTNLHNHRWNPEGYRPVHSYGYVKPMQLQCNCGVDMKIMVEIKETDNIHYHSILDRPMEYEREIVYCPKCGDRFAVIGKVKQIHIEVD